MTIYRFILGCVAAASVSCTPTVHNIGLRAPNPNGCYAVVYDQDQFEGAADLFNGPARFASLKSLSQANYANWHNRIHSIRVGPAATVTMYEGPSFTGSSTQFAASTEHAAIAPRLSGRVQSFELACLNSVPTS